MSTSKLLRLQPWPEPARGMCQIRECFNPTFGARYCSRCAEEIPYLDAWAARREQKKARRSAWRAGVLTAIHRRIWMGELALLLAALAYVATAIGMPWLDWLMSGGVQ